MIFDGLIFAIFEFSDSLFSLVVRQLYPTASPERFWRPPALAALVIHL